MGVYRSQASATCAAAGVGPHTAIKSTDTRNTGGPSQEVRARSAADRDRRVIRRSSSRPQVYGGERRPAGRLRGAVVDREPHQITVSRHQGHIVGPWRLWNAAHVRRPRDQVAPNLKGPLAGKPLTLSDHVELA